MEIKVAIDQYRYAILHHTAGTQRWYVSRLARFASWCEQETLRLEAIKTHDIRKYLEFLRTTISDATGKQLSSYTVHGHARAIRAFLLWCSQEDGLEKLVSAKTPSRIGMPHLEQKILETLTDEHIRVLFAACDSEFLPHLVVRDQAILSVLLDTGIRANELCTLTLENTVTKPEEAYLRIHGKGNKWREVGLGKQARTSLHRYTTRYRKAPQKEERYVFLGRYGNPLTLNGLDQMLYRLAEWAHLEHVRVSAHVWRHTFAIKYLEAGGDIYKLSRLMGHTSVKVTEGYLQAVKQRAARQAGVSVLDIFKGQR